jgi:predicted Zn finger-like uncharacterized protein
MKFVCDSCHAQYLISDEKVGPNGVIVRCKKCQHKIVVKRPAPPPDPAEETIVSDNPLAHAGEEGTFNNPVPPPAENASEAAASPPPPVPGIDDELGRAFESVLAKQGVADNGSASAPTQAEMPAVGSGVEGMPFASSEAQVPPPSAMAAMPPGGDAMGDEADTDRQSTRVVNLNEMAGLIRAEAQEAAAAAQPAPPPPEPMREEKPAKKNGSNGTAVAADWFVAINDNQVGPLNFDGVLEKWEKGELSADSLCWKPGMPDWRALSSVPELAEKLAPRPPPTADKEAPAGAVATGAQASAPTPLPPQQDEPGEPEWTPSAASALESLVKDELEALQKPPEKKPEEPPPVEARPRGLMDDLPDESERPEVDHTSPMAMQRNLSEEEEADAPPPPAPYSDRRHISRPPGSRPPEYVSRPPGEYAEPVPMMYMPPKSRTGLYVALGIIGGLGIICTTVVVVVLMLRNPTSIQPQPNPSPTVAAPTTPQPVPATNQAAPPASPEKVAEATKPDDKAADKDKAGDSKDKPDTKLAVNDKPENKVDAKPPKNPEKIDKPIHNSPGINHTGTHETKTTKADKDPPKEPATTKPDEEKPGGKKPGGGNTATKDEPTKPKDTKQKTVYIPPAPGQGGGPAKANDAAPAAPKGPAKDTLSQADVMEVVLASKPKIKQCTDDAKAAAPGTSGTIVMRWTIRSDGSATNIQTVTEDFRKTPLSACLTGMIKSFKFPAYTGPLMQPIDFPFKF